ncbi:MAG: hypothetical protein U0Z53_07190 [Blastocatellia bacterium]
MNVRRGPDIEKMAFDLIEQHAPRIAEMLLEMAAGPESLPELTVRLRAMAVEDELPPEDFKAAAMALRYARRSLLPSAAAH